MPQRYFINPNHQNKIIGQDVHHIKHVMRMKINDEIIVCDSKACFLAIITKINDVVEFSIKEEIKHTPTTSITLIQGLPKHPKTEFITKYATMFGVSSIIFSPMERSISKLENIENKQRRLSIIAKEASELSHRHSIPNIYLKELKHIDFQQFDCILVADEQEKEIGLHTLDIKPYQQKIAIIIGPEGGLSDHERILFKGLHAIPVSLGSYILPTEAASLYVLSQLSSKFI